MLFEKLYSGRVSTRLITHFHRKAKREREREEEREREGVGLMWVFAMISGYLLP